MRLVQVGVRGMGNHWVGVGRRNPDVEVVGYVDVVPEHLEQLQREHGVPASACHTDLAAALEALRPDAVLCVVPPAFHRDVALRALRAGCHVLTEKPLADTWERCLEMEAEARRAGRILMVAQNYRYSRPVQTLRRVLREGGLGRPGQAAVHFFKGPHFGGFREEMAQPLLVDMSIHHFDLMRYLLQAEPVSVFARSWNPHWSWYRGDASATVHFEMRPADGDARPIEVTYTGSWCAHGGGTPWNGEWRILCTDGCAMLRDDRVSVQRRDGEPWTDVPLDPLPSGGQDRLLQEFVAAVREGRRPETDAEDNLGSIAMVFATVRSLEAGGPVPVAVRG